MGTGPGNEATFTHFGEGLGMRLPLLISARAWLALLISDLLITLQIYSSNFKGFTQVLSSN